MSEEVKAKVPPPYPLAIVICDDIHQDPATGKRYLLGTFSVIHARVFPAVHPRLAVLVVLTNGRGKVPFKFQLVDADEERDPLFVAEGELEFTDPRAILELGFSLSNLTFPAPGEYRFQFFGSDEFLIERRMVLAPMDETDEQHGHEA